MEVLIGHMNLMMLITLEDLLDIGILLDIIIQVRHWYIIRHFLMKSY
jgi:hypothetical protein